MDGSAMKRLLVRLSIASGVIVAVLVTIAVAKALGWGKQPEAVVAQEKVEKPTQAQGDSAAAPNAVASELMQAAAQSVPLKDPFQPPVKRAQYNPEEYYEDTAAQAPAAEDASQYEDNGAVAAEETYAAADETAVEPPVDPARPTAQDPFDAHGATQQRDPSAVDEGGAVITETEAPHEAFEEDADFADVAPEAEAAAAPIVEDVTQEAETSEQPGTESTEAQPAPARFAASANEERAEPQPRPLPAQDEFPDAAQDYVEQQFPVTESNAPAVEEPPRNEAPAAARRQPVQSAVEGAGVPGDPKLEAEQGAALVIHKTGPPEVQLGLETVYEIRVQNVGDAPAHEVEVRDVAPRGADLIATQPQVTPGANGELVWSLGTLAPGEEAIVQMRVIPRTEGEIGSVARVVFSADAAARTLVTKPVLELTVEAPKTVLAGERAQLFVRVTNTGTGVATGVVLEEVVPPGFQHAAGATLEYRVGTLKPRDSRELPLTLSAKKPSDTVNVVTVRADGDIVVEERTPLSIIAPALQIAMQGPRRRFLDRDATYTVAVSNPGTAPAHEIELVTFLAEGMEFVSADSAGQYDPQTRAVYWLLDELPPNEMGSVTVTARPTKPGEHILRVEGRAQRGLEAIEEQPILVEGLAAVEFQVIDLSDPVELGGEAAYEVIVKNSGTKASSAVELVATLPVEMQLISADGPTRFKSTGQKIHFEPLKSLAPGESVSYQLTAKTVDAGDARLQVKLITAEMQSPVTKEENTKVFGDE